MIRPLLSSICIFTDTLQALQRSRAPGADVAQLQMTWARTVLARMEVRCTQIGEASPQSPLLFVGNHISYLDIPLLISMAPHLSFVAKREIQNWPIFGVGAKKMKTVFVNRETGASREKAREAIRESLRAGQRIAIFPSGTTSLAEEKPWKKGAFELAQSLHAKIQPFRISYSPLRTAAFIDQDSLPTHLYRLSKAGGTEARIEFHEPVCVNDPAEDAKIWQNWTREMGASPALQSERSSSRVTQFSAHSAV